MMVPVNVARVILEMKNDISRMKHAMEMLTVCHSAGPGQAQQCLLSSELCFPIESLPVGTEEDFDILCPALEDITFQKHLKSTLNLLGGTKIQEITRLILRALMSKDQRLNYVAQKKNTGKKFFKGTKMWPFVRGKFLPFTRCHFRLIYYFLLSNLN